MHDDLLFPNHIMALGICLRGLPHVTSLELRSCSMNDEGASTLPLPLFSLWLDRGSSRELLGGVRSRCNLTVDGPTFTPVAALRALLGEIRSLGLVELRLQQNQFSPHGCEAIAQALEPPSPAADPGLRSVSSLQGPASSDQCSKNARLWG